MEKFNNISILIYLLIIFIYVLIISIYDDIKKIKKKSKEKKSLLDKKDIKYKEDKSLLKQVVNSCYIGIIRGGIFGYITGDPKQAIINSAIFGTINPTIFYIQYLYFNNNKL